MSSSTHRFLLSELNVRFDHLLYIQGCDRSVLVIELLIISLYRTVNFNHRVITVHKKISNESLIIFCCCPI